VGDIDFEVIFAAESLKIPKISSFRRKNQLRTW
jgi:hypothetical protein